MDNLSVDSNNLHWEKTTSLYADARGKEIEVTTYLHKPTGRRFYRSSNGAGEIELFDQSADRDGSLLSPGGAERYRPKV